SLWRNIPHEFDDYIASPKENGYRSLHTAVWGPENKVLEIQIRTQEMHEESELGVCAHWRYKGTDTKSTQDAYEQKISWLRQVLEWHEELEGRSEERRVGKECRSRWSLYQCEKKIQRYGVRTTYNIYTID